MPVFSNMSRDSNLYHNLSASMSSDPSTHIGRQAVDTGRRTNKFTKSREKVWPEELEKALLEALAEYRPTSAKDPRLLQRFPRRNKHIADKILEKTGCKRTPKQVGSRLQQLRETCSNPYVLHLIRSKNFGDQPTTLDDTSSSTSHITAVGEWCLSEHSTSSPPSLDNRALSRFSSVSSELSQNGTASSSTSLPAYSFLPVLDVSLILSDFDFCATAPNADPSFTLDLDEHALTDYATSLNSSYPTFTRRAEIRAPHAISQCTPVVNFSSQRFLPDGHYQCVTEVCRDQELVYSRLALLERRYLGAESTALSMPLLPDFWAIITSNPEDYRSYTITQKIYSISNDAMQKDFPLFSVHYTMERGLNPPTYVALDVLPPPPYLDGLSLQTNSHGPLHFRYPAPLSELPSTSYFNNSLLAYPASQIPDPSFFAPPLDQDLLSMSHELNSFPTYF